MNSFTFMIFTGEIFLIVGSEIRPGRGLATYVSEKLNFTACFYSIKELFLFVQLYYPPLIFKDSQFSTRPGTAVNEIDNPRAYL